MPAAILSPHLDDAVLSAWSVLRGDADALVVNVFDGVPPPGTLSRWDRVTGASDSNERMRERLEEDRAALAIAGRPSVSLGLLEAEYRDGPPDPGALADALEGAVQDAHEVWAPAGLGRHPDHVIVRDWALAAGLDAPLRLWADLPYAARHGWPAWVTATEPDPYYAQERAWERDLPGGVDLEAASHDLDPAEVELKQRALWTYRTQVYALDAGPIGMLRNPLVIGHEVSFAVRG